MAVLEEFNQINDSFGLPEVYEDAEKMDKLMDRQALLQDKIDALGAWEIDTKLEIAMDALRTQMRIRLLRTFLVNVVVLLCVVCYYNSRTCCFLMNLRITWMRKVYFG
jgi:hypothetical protein